MDQDSALPLIPASRIRQLNEQPIQPRGDYVLYWMTAARRTRFNFALQRSVDLATELGKPLLILEAVRAAYPFASDRLHAFIVDGMRDNARAVGAQKATYYPYIEPEPGAGRGLLAELAARSCVVVTDWFPEFFLPRMTTAAAAQVSVRLEAVDGNGVLPVAEHGQAFPTARGYRAFMQRNLRKQLAAFPDEDPLARLEHTGPGIPARAASRWPAADLETTTARIVAALPIDHTVPVSSTKGGATTGSTALEEFLARKLARYAEEGNDPDAEATSRLSPYLHFGHVSAHEVFSALMTRERWTSRRLGHAGSTSHGRNTGHSTDTRHRRSTGETRQPADEPWSLVPAVGRTRAGAREGWWNVSPGAERFLDQLVVWRELAFNAAEWVPQNHAYSAVPAWARATLEAHLDDPRPHLYALDQLDAADTADVVWNAAQTELRETGWFHGYMRMVWGKKILEWSRHPAEALERMELLMNRYSLDGRDPVSYLNYAWVLGRYDRPWFERPIFGTVRYMTSESARRKLKMKAYLARFGRPR